MEKNKGATNSKINKKVHESVLHSLELLKNEALELYIPKEIAVLHNIPTPLQFHQKWVAPNLPVLIKGGCRTWGATKKWNKEYFIKILKDKKISVSVTPNGLGDSIQQTKINGTKQDVFVLPEERLMTISDFYKELDDAEGKNFKGSEKTKNKVFYIQKQNSNLTEEFPELLPDIDKDLPWASESFSSQPTAINLWIGDERAVSSLHKDPFENIYCVISGHKDFILLPPTDRPWLPYKTLSVGQYEASASGDFSIKILEKRFSSSIDDLTKSDSSVELVPWIDIDPLHPNTEKYPLYSNASPLYVRVDAGDMLYLPSLWFHHVRQSHKCIAVNYWYDMNFDIKYAYFMLLENLSKYIEISPG